MSSPPIVISQDASVEEAARLMLENGFGALPVVDDKGIIVGLISESTFAAKSVGLPFSIFRAPQILGKWMSDDRLDEIYRSARSLPVRQVMVKDVVTIKEDAPASEAVKLMLDHDINRIPVVRENKPIGMIARHDLLRMLILGKAGSVR